MISKKNSTINLPVVLHIGYHKTGTTYLQKNFFSKHPEVLYLGAPWLNDRIANFFRRFRYTHDIDYSPSKFKAEFRSILQTNLETYHRGSDVKVIVVSSESLHSGPEWFGMQLKNMADRLKSTFAPCKIILGIRNQPEYVESNYKEYVIHGGKIGFHKFLYSSFACSHALLPKLKYDKVISLYSKKFGKDSVWVYLQEDLKQHPSKTLSEFMEFMGINSSLNFRQEIVYGGLNKTLIEILRSVNKLLANDYIEQYYQVGVPESWAPKEKMRRWIGNKLRRVNRIIERVDKLPFLKTAVQKRYLTNKDLNYLKMYFQQSNDRLSKLLGRDLCNLGYYYR